MAIMALTLGLDPAFVGGHQFLRLVGLNLLGASWLRPARGRARHGATVRPSADAHSRSSSANEAADRRNRAIKTGYPANLP